MNASANAVRIAPSPATIAAEIDDLMNDLPGNDPVAHLGHKRQIDGGNEKIDGMAGDLESVLVDDFVTCSAQDGIHDILLFVTAIKDFRRNMLLLFLRKPMDTIL